MISLLSLQARNWVRNETQFIINKCLCNAHQTSGEKGGGAGGRRMGRGVEDRDGEKGLEQC